MQINFYPDWDNPELTAAVEDYKRIWLEIGNATVKELQQRTQLKFRESVFTAVVYDGMSLAKPLLFRYSYQDEIKATTIVHELGHRLLSGNGFKRDPGPEQHVNAHKLLYLFLFEVYISLFGESKAAAAVEWESNLRPSHRNCWNWALALSLNQREKRFHNARDHRENWTAHLGDPV